MKDDTVQYEKDAIIIGCCDSSITQSEHTAPKYYDVVRRCMAALCILTQINTRSGW